MWNPSTIHGPFYFPKTRDSAGNITDFFPGYYLLVDPALMSSDLEPFRIDMPAPVEWAGQDSAYLQFDSEADARASSLGAQWLEPDTIPGDAKLLKKLEIDAQLQQAFNRGFTIPSGTLAGKVLQCRDVTDRTNWLASSVRYAAAIQSGAGTVEGATFRTADNETVTVTYSEGYSIIMDLGNWATALMANSWRLKDALAAAEDPSAVDTSEGWDAPAV